MNTATMYSDLRRAELARESQAGTNSQHLSVSTTFSVNDRMLTIP